MAIRSLRKIAYRLFCTAFFRGTVPKFLVVSAHSCGSHHGYLRLQRRHNACTTYRSEGIMFSIHIESVGDMAVVQCEGRLVQSEAAFRLRDAILSQRNSRVVVGDLSEVRAIEGGGVGMLG